jgi:hypothetical protein
VPSQQRQAREQEKQHDNTLHRYNAAPCRTRSPPPTCRRRQAHAATPRHPAALEQPQVRACPRAPPTHYREDTRVEGAYRAPGTPNDASACVITRGNSSHAACRRPPFLLLRNKSTPLVTRTSYHLHNGSRGSQPRPRQSCTQRSGRGQGSGGQGRLSGRWGTACLRRAAAAREPAMVAAPPNKTEQPTHSVVVSSYAGRKGRVAWKTHRRAAPGCSPCACAATNAAAAAPSLRTTPPPPAAWATSVACTGTITCYVLQRVWGARASALCAGSGRSSSRAMWVVDTAARAAG